jgi:membrane fusion protein (multidrug efflux system)
VVAPQTANLSTELAGRIDTVGFAPGAKVTKGQLLLALDTSEESARLRAAKADQEIAKLGFDRAERLVKRGAGSLEDRDRARAQFAAAKANAETLQAIINKKRIMAPFDATTSLHQLEPGQYLAANTNVAQLVGANGQVWIDFSLPQQQANSVAGDFVRVIQNNNSIGQAKIIGRDATVEQNSRSLKFRAQFEQSAALYPGMLVSIDVSVGDLESVIAVPATAIRRSALGTVVYVIGSAPASPSDSKKSGDSESEALRAQRRSVTVGERIDFDPTTQQQLVVVETGLEAGERIAANGAFKLRDGIKVNLLEQRPAGTGE